MANNLVIVNKDSFFTKIKKLFFKNRNEHDEKKLISKNIPKAKNSFVEEQQLKSRRYDYLLLLQKKFELGEVKEEDISEEDKNDLKRIYIEQIQTLKNKVSYLKGKLE